MQRRVFLSGENAFELLQDVLSDHLSMAGGYITRRIGGEDGSPAREALFPAAAAAGVEGFCGARYLTFADGVVQKDNEVFRTQAVRLLEEAQFYPFALLAEFGGYEIVIAQYRAALSGLLSSALPCVGVLKPLAEAQLQGQLLGLGERYDALLRQLHAALENDRDTLLLTLPDDEGARARQALESWMEAFLN